MSNFSSLYTLLILISFSFLSQIYHISSTDPVGFWGVAPLMIMYMIMVYIFSLPYFYPLYRLCELGETTASWSLVSIPILFILFSLVIQKNLNSIQTEDKKISPN